MFESLNKVTILLILSSIIFASLGCRSKQEVTAEKFMELLLSNPNKTNIYVEPMGVKNGNAILRFSENPSGYDDRKYTYYYTPENNLPAEWEEITTQKWNPEFIGTVKSIYKFGPNPSGEPPYRSQWYAAIKIEKLISGIYGNEKITLNLGDTNSTSLKKEHTYKFGAIQGRHGHHLSTYQEIQK